MRHQWARKGLHFKPNEGEGSGLFTLLLFLEETESYSNGTLNTKKKKNTNVALNHL